MSSNDRTFATTPNVCSAIFAEDHEQCSREGCMTPITTPELFHFTVWSIALN